MPGEPHLWVSPIPAWTLVGRRLLVGAVGLAAVSWLVLGSRTGFNIFDGPLRLKAVSSIATSAPVAGIIVDGPQGTLAATAAALKARGIRASVAVSEPQSIRTLGTIRAAGSDLIPHLRKSGAFRWLATRSRLKALILDLQLHKPFAYQPPARGFSIGEYEAAKSLGGKPVKGEVTVTSQSTTGALSRGEIIVVVINSDPRSLGALDEIRRALARNHLRAVPVSELLR